MNTENQSQAGAAKPRPWWRRLLRKILSHTICVHLCLERGHPPLQFAMLLD